MNNYKTYFDSQTISPEAEKRLLGLCDTQKPKKAARIKPTAAMAACCAVIVGIALYGNRQDAPLPPDGLTEEQTDNQPDENNSPSFFMIPSI